jgi:hypothetical protein
VRFGYFERLTVNFCEIRYTPIPDSIIAANAASMEMNKYVETSNQLQAGLMTPIAGTYSVIPG